MYSTELITWCTGTRLRSIDLGSALRGLHSAPPILCDRNCRCKGPTSWWQYQVWTGSFCTTYKSSAGRTMDATSLWWMVLLEKKYRADENRNFQWGQCAKSPCGTNICQSYPRCRAYGALKRSGLACYSDGIAFLDILKITNPYNWEPQKMVIGECGNNNALSAL